MEKDRLSRTRLMLGEEAVEKLGSSKVIVFGAGGVGGYVIEALARSGVGEIAVVDSDDVDVTNLNRQILATASTVGRPKTEAAKLRMEEAAPGCRITELRQFFSPEDDGGIDFHDYDYVVDAVDTVKAKVEIIRRSVEAGTPVISCMGAGNKLDPTAFCVTDIAKTEMDPLAKVMRRKLRDIGIRHCKVVFSKEKPRKSTVPDGKEGERHAPGSIAFVPAAAGLAAASCVVRDLIGETD